MQLHVQFWQMFCKIRMASYRTQSALRNKLDDLYGTVLYTDAAKRGDTHIVSLNVECVNDEYLTDGGVLDEVN